MKFTSAAVFLEPAYQGNGTDLAGSGGSFPCIPLPPARGKVSDRAGPYHVLLHSRQRLLTDVEYMRVF